MASGKIVQLHIKKDYGTVQVHNLPDFLVFSALFPKLTGARVILDLHDLMPEFFAAKSGSNLSSWKVRLVILQEQLSCRFADHVITVTDVWKETLIERGVPAHKVSVVMNVADDRVFHRNGENRKTERDRDLFELIYHGTFTHRYGVDLIIDAVNKLRNKIPDIHLTLLGDGETLDALVELTYQLDIKDHVVFSPTLHVSELPKYIQQADVGIVPNRSNIFTDGILPTKMMEYIAMGTPVIAARTPTIETYFDDSMVLFFKPGDVDDLSSCILSLYKDRQMLMQFPQNADKFNQQYNWDKVAAGYLAQVDRLFMTNGGFKNEGKSRLAKTNPNSSGLGRNKN
jgi:glycosyltransferase involved in cell wall biosynthesis